MDSDVTDNITRDLERPTIHDKYGDGEQVHTAKGIGMEITHVGQTSLHSPSREIHLKNVLRVPQAHKNLVFVNHLTRDNNVFLEFHLGHFSIKEQVTKRTLHIGRCEGGLYPLRSSLNKQVLGAIKWPASLWHSSLGHTSTRVV
jgi:hypothetical protein